MTASLNAVLCALAGVTIGFCCISRLMGLYVYEGFSEVWL